MLNHSHLNHWGAEVRSTDFMVPALLYLACRLFSKSKGLKGLLNQLKLFTLSVEQALQLFQLLAVSRTSAARHEAG